MIRDARRARQLARVLISDLVAYDADEVRIGLEKDDLFERVGPQLERAFIFYAHRVDADLPQRETLFNHAVVDILLFSHRHLATHVFS